MATRVDEPDSATMYVGEAPIGTLPSADSWRIKKMTISGALTLIQWAGDGGFNQVWDNRTGLTYA